MNVMAMDTSSLTATVAVLNDEKLLGEFTISNKLTHSQTILPMTEKLLSMLGMSLDEIDVFAVCVGPGSFTGLRIGMATVKTFAQTLNKPIIGISSLDAIAYNLSYNDDFIICPIVDSRRNEVYNALYNCGVKILEDRHLHIDDLLVELQGKKVIFAGDAVMLHRERIETLKESGWRIASNHLLLPSAASAAYCAYKKAIEGQFDDPYTLNPVYLRKSQAERELEEKIKHTEEEK